MDSEVLGWHCGGRQNLIAMGAWLYIKRPLYCLSIGWMQLWLHNLPPSCTPGELCHSTYSQPFSFWSDAIGSTLSKTRNSSLTNPFRIRCSVGLHGWLAKTRWSIFFQVECRWVYIGAVVQIRHQKWWLERGRGMSLIKFVHLPSWGKCRWVYI